MKNRKNRKWCKINDKLVFWLDYVNKYFFNFCINYEFIFIFLIINKLLLKLIYLDLIYFQKI